MINFLIHTQDINKDFTSFYQALYMEREWGVEVGYSTIPMYLANMRKRMLDYQEVSSADCDNQYFTASQGSIDYSCCTSGSTKVTGSGNITCCPDGATFNVNTGLCEGTIDTPPAPGCTCYTITTNNKWYQYDVPLCTGLTISTVVFPGSPQQFCVTAVPTITDIEPGSQGSSESRQISGPCYVNANTYSCTPGTTVTTTEPPVECPCCPDGYTYVYGTGLCTHPNTGSVTQPVDCVPRCVNSFGADTPFVSCGLMPDSVILTYPGLGDGLCCETMITPWEDCDNRGNDQWDIRNRHLG